MHIPLLRTLVLVSLIAVLAACSGVDAPTTDAELETSALFVGREYDADDNDPRFLRPANGVCFYRDANFATAPGNDVLCFTSDNPTPVGFTSVVPRIRSAWNDRVSSVVVAPGYDVVMYTGGDFTGRATVVGSENAYARAPRVRYNDSLSSFKIVRTSNQTP